MPKIDPFWFWVVLIVVALAAILSFAVNFKYTMCMEVKNDHDECVYDVACNS